MRLSSRDLDLIRDIVRSELARVGLHEKERPLAENQDDDDIDPEMERRVSEDLARWRREDAERAARPIPKEGDLDMYDAARVSGAMIDTIGGWMRRGWLPKRKVKGKLVVDRATLELFLADRRRP